ncbi:UNVERIFIED_CONTAM: hypothetical protein FKN15_065147 [Acipenser sinensis]
MGLRPPPPSPLITLGSRPPRSLTPVGSPTSLPWRRRLTHSWDRFNALDPLPYQQRRRSEPWTGRQEHVPAQHSTAPRRTTLTGTMFPRTRARTLLCT